MFLTSYAFTAVATLYYNFVTTLSMHAWTLLSLVPQNSKNVNVGMAADATGAVAVVGDIVDGAAYYNIKKCQGDNNGGTKATRDAKGSDKDGKDGKKKKKRREEEEKKGFLSKMKDKAAFITFEAGGVLGEFIWAEVLGDSLREAVFEQDEEAQEEKEEEEKEKQRWKECEEEESKKRKEKGLPPLTEAEVTRAKGKIKDGKEEEVELGPDGKPKKKSFFGKMKGAASFVVGEAAGMVQEFAVTTVLG